MQGGVLGLGLAGLACLMLLGAVHGGSARLPALALTGWAIGVCLIKSSFGFAGGFRALVERRDFIGFKAQAVSLAVASVFFFPVLAAGKMGWINAAGYGSPVSLPFLGGALAFGIGM